jgi:cobalt transporter subunit CbtB
MQDALKSSLATTAVPSLSVRIADRMPVIAVLVFGLVLLYGVGFSTVNAAHSAAHDTRHASGFPCH